MKIALTCPTYWPYYKRGERYVNGLARFLSKQGHEVTVVTSKPGRTRKIYKDGIRVIYHREFSHPLLPEKYRYHFHALSCLLPLLRERFDIIQSLFYIDAFSASLSRMFTKTHHVYFIVNCDPFHWDRWLDRFMFERATGSAVALVAISRYLQKSLKDQYGLDGTMIPAGVDSDYFRPSARKDLESPRILCMVAEFRATRKRVPVLIKAFERFKASSPKAILQLCGRIDPILAREYLELVSPGVRPSIHFLGPGTEEEVPSYYAQAAMTVLPSIKEPFGMVLMESLSAGTPVVGTRDGGIPEIIDNPRVGVMFEGEGEQAVEALDQAMRQCLELAKDPETSGRCREHSKNRYDWSVIGSKLEELYYRVLEKPAG